MPSSHLSAQALPGNSSSSRKRTHAEIASSLSRSQSPQRRAKRRRTMSSPSPPSPTSSISSMNSPTGVRFAGDGLDFRRPAMSTTPRMRAHDQNTIDLTLDDDTPPLPHAATAHTTQWFDLSEEASSDAPQAQHAPPFAVQHGYNDDQPQAVIDLLSEDDDDDEDEHVDGQPRAGGGIRLEASSPEIEFMGARPIPQPAAENIPTRRQLHLPPLPNLGNLGHFGSIANFLGVAPNFLGNFRRENPEATLNRIDGLLNHPAAGAAGVEPPPDVFYNEFDDLQMDYGRAAFDIDGNMLLNFQQVGPNRPNESAYKEPLPPREGFTRNYEEDDMLICGLCEDELATGDTEQKQQVWIIKQCGHAYCGDCAHNRNMSKQKSNKDTKRATSKKPNGFKTCAVPDCKRAVDSKTKMFQIYL